MAAIANGICLCCNCRIPVGVDLHGSHVILPHFAPRTMEMCGGSAEVVRDHTIKHTDAEECPELHLFEDDRIR